MNTPKNCETCKYEKALLVQSPCRGCCYFAGDQYDLLWEPKEKEDEKMDNRKTKAQLMEELEQKNAEIAELKVELNKTERYDGYLNEAKQLREWMDAYTEVGFTESQAFDILKIFLAKSFKNK